MIKKIFKTILVLSLCLGITFPTNAAVSVSDGSAFVTKAEFAADLNNLSNRMAQLENSLDAKIDSMVSSYLSRNGIWNGVDQSQVLLNTTYSIPFPLNNNDDNSTFASETALSSSPRTITNFVSDLNNLTNFNLFSNTATISKSGLLVVSHKFESVNSEVYMFTYGSYGYIDRNYKFNLYVGLKMATDRADSQFIENEIGSATATDVEAINFRTAGYGHNLNLSRIQTNFSDDYVRSGYGSIKLFQVKSWYKQDIMFVQKGDKLKLSVHAFATGNTYDSFFKRGSGDVIGNYTITSLTVF